MEEIKERWVFIERDGVQFDITELKEIRQDAVRAKQFLRITGTTLVPDKIHEILHLKTSRATLARKMREACARGELLRKPYTNERGTEIAAYAWNPDYKE